LEAKAAKGLSASGLAGDGSGPLRQQFEKRKLGHYRGPGIEKRRRRDGRNIGLMRVL
jgi:hypothetical protein